MTASEAYDVLIGMNINPRSFSVDGTDLGNQFVLKNNQNGSWSVYYSEFGKSDEILFEKEYNACLYLIKTVSSDNGTYN